MENKKLEILKDKLEGNIYLAKRFNVKHGNIDFSKIPKAWRDLIGGGIFKDVDSVEYVRKLRGHSDSN